MDPFVGRQAELGVLRARMADARAGSPQIVQVSGPPGIGKTALLEHFLAEPGEDGAPVVVRASGEEAERLLDYGVVDQLARSAGPAGAELAGAAAAEPADPVDVGVRLLALLGDLETVGPVVLVVDDLHWADQPSVRAVVFALRRLVADQVLVLLATREDERAELPESLRRLVRGRAGSQLRLRGLDEEDLTDLAELMGVRRFPAQAARRLRSGTQGNPLHARALLEEFPPQEWGGDQQPLPSPRSFRLVVASRAEPVVDGGAHQRMREGQGPGQLGAGREDEAAGARLVDGA